MDNLKKDQLKIVNKKFNSRLIVGTGKYKNMQECAKAVKFSGAEIVTVAVRRVNIIDKNKPLLMDYLDPKKITYLPNTAGCFNSKEALRTLRLAREIGGWKLVKLEVLGDKKTLYPDMIETLNSTKILTKEGFKVMVYCFCNLALTFMWNHVTWFSISFRTLRLSLLMCQILDLL